MPRLRKPRRVRPGDALAVVAPAFAADAERLAAGEAQLRDLGFEPRRRPDVLDRWGYLAGDDARRAEELMAWVDEPSVSGIVCARGGYGCQRLLSRLDAARVRAARKALVGFSDITSLLLWQRRVAGLVGFHGPVLERREALGEEELDALRRALAGEPLAPWRGRALRRGRARGRLVGGSLMLLAASLGTPWELDTRGAILLFEEIGEKPYSIDRLLCQLRAAGKLEGLAGVGVGHLVDCIDPKRVEPTAEAVLEEVLAPLGVPLVIGLPFGHRRPNLTWPMGVHAEIDGDRGELRVLEAGVTR